LAKYRRKKASGQDRRGWCELWGVLLLVFAALCFMAVYSDAAGAVGRWLSALLRPVLGRGALFFWVLPAAAGGYLAATGKPIPADSRLAGVVLAWLLAQIALHFPAPAGAEMRPEVILTYGGWVGAVAGHLLLLGFGRQGRAVVLIGLALASGLAITRVSVGRAIGLGLGGLRWLATTLVRQVRELFAGARSVSPGSARPASFKETADGRLVRADRPAGGKRGRSAADTGDDLEPEIGTAPDPGPKGKAAPGAAGAESSAAGLPGTASAAVTPAGGPGGAAPGAPGASPPDGAGPPGGSRSGGAVADGVLSVPPFGGSSSSAAAYTVVRPYQLPPLTLLRKGSRQRPGRAAQDAESRARLLEDTFASFGVGVKVMEINPGPTVTRFEVRPAPGVKVSKIESLADDIALSLAAADVRIAPIPGKGLIGIEVPNTEVSVVHLREVLESAEFGRHSSRLAFAVGKDIAGQVILADLERLLHLLIAGATGSGKSVCLNALIASILFKARPDEVKLLLIDPKVVELQVYDGIPHLLAPVINDPKKAAQILRWAVKEMLDRYYRFSEVGVRNIGDYNRLMDQRQGDLLDWDGSLETPGGDPDAAGPVSPARMPGPLARAGASPEPGNPLPHIVIVIDELADLMMVAPVEVEDSIWRLAQMARAAGIHLVVATQRPSVNVITGVIKANIPSRIAFAVASQVDSRTILDMAGAEKLLGRGDMLFYPIGASKPMRAQGALITDREVEELVRYVKQQADPNYMESFPVPDQLEQDSSRELDPKWGDALRVVFENGQASTSMLQRRLRIGYTRAARIVDIMEEMGIVAKSDGVKPRDVLMSMDQYVERHGPLDDPDRDRL